MKRVLYVLVTMLTMVAGAVALGGSANAGPAETINQKWTCETLPSGDELCSSLRQVIQQEAGNAGSHYNAVYSACARYTSNGQVVYDICNTGREIHNTSSAGHGVDQSAYRQTYAFVDALTGITYTCVNISRFLTANGHVIRAEFTTECDPPLPA